MRGRILAALLILIIFLLSGLVYVINISDRVKEGFTTNIGSEGAAYNNLRKRLLDTMTPYCNLSGFIEEQMKTMYMASKFSESGSTIAGNSEAEATARIKKTYSDVYNCKDELAESRASCSGVTGTSDDQHVPCSVYLNPPSYDPDEHETITTHLMEIPDNLPLLLLKELDWYDSVMNYLQNGLNGGANPPSAPPEGPNSPAPPDGKSWKVEGFANKCSPQAAKMRRKRLEDLKLRKLQKEAGTCNVPELSSEISRVNSLLDSNGLKNVMSRSNGMLAKAMKLKSDLQKLQDGNLYAWQQSGPKKSYASFKGGDRTASFVFSMQQNR
jgi:hypothetical protein